MRSSSGIAVRCRLRAGLRAKASNWRVSVAARSDSVHDVLQKFAQRRRQIRLAQAQGGVAVDAGQQVVELVSHAARQRADALHLLRLQQLAFQLLVLA